METVDITSFSERLGVAYKGRLNEATQAWVEYEYHRTGHSELGQTPLSL